MKNPKIIELFIEDLDDEAGIDFISIVSDPAIQRNFLAFKDGPKVMDKQRQNDIIKLLEEEEIGVSKDILKRSKIIKTQKVESGRDYLEIMKKMNGEFLKRSAIKGKTDSDSFLDYGGGDNRTHVRFYYEGPTDSRNRDFCGFMMRSKSNTLFRYEDIMYMTSNDANDEFGYYDIFQFKGSYGCRHFWTRVDFQVIDDRKVNPKIQTPTSEAEQVNKPPVRITQEVKENLSTDEFKTWTGYPITARNNAEKARLLNELKTPSAKCMTLTGRRRAGDIEKGKGLSDDIMKRTFSYLSRARSFYNPEELRGRKTDEELKNVSCGTISYLGWGGTPMFNWVSRRMKDIQLSSDVEMKTMKTEFQSIDEEKRTITGVSMVPNETIFRYDPEKDEEFYVYFTKRTIRLLMEKFMLEANNKNVDLEHNGIKVKAGVIESWIIEGESDKAYELGFDKESAPKGSWMVSMKILDDELWEMIKNDPENLNGFSVAGNFLSKVDRYSSEEVIMEQIKEVLKGLK